MLVGCEQYYQLEQLETRTFNKTFLRDDMAVAEPGGETLFIYMASSGDKEIRSK